LLRLRSQRPRRRTAEHTEKFAPPHVPSGSEGFHNGEQYTTSGRGEIDQRHRLL